MRSALGLTALWLFVPLPPSAQAFPASLIERAVAALPRAFLHLFSDHVGRRWASGR